MTRAEREEQTNRILEAQREAWRAEEDHERHVEALADTWRAVELAHGEDLARFRDVCPHTDQLRIPPMLLQHLLDPYERPEAEAFERLGFRIRDEHERWADVAELTNVLRQVLPESTAHELLPLDRDADSDAYNNGDSDTSGRGVEGGAEYQVFTGIVGPNGVVGMLTTTWAIESAYDGTLAPTLRSASCTELPSPPVGQF